MLSDHELTVKVRDDLYHRARQIEAECLELFNLQRPISRGPTGVQGTNELAWTIGYLHAAANELERIGQERGLLPPPYHSPKPRRPFRQHRAADFLPGCGICFPSGHPFARYAAIGITDLSVSAGARLIRGTGSLYKGMEKR